MLYYLALLLPCFTCLAWALILISKWTTNNNAQNTVAINLLLLSFCALSFSDILLQSDNYTWRYIENAIHISVATLVFPLLVRYFRLLTTGKKLKWWNNLIFLPTVISAIVVTFAHLKMGHETSVIYVRDFLYAPDAMTKAASGWLSVQINTLYWIGAVIFAQAIYLIIYALVSLKRYGKDLNDFYSNRNDKGIGVSYVMLFAIISYFVFLVISTSITIDVMRSNTTITVVLVLIFTGILYTLASCANNAKQTAAHMTALAEQVDNEVPLIVLDSQNDAKKRGYPSSLRSKFNRLIDDDKIFLQPNLRIDEISRTLSTNRTYILRMINDTYGMTFFDYINSRRVEYAKALLIAEPDMGQDEMAQRSGFVYASTFCRVFRQKTGCAPSQWRKENESKK